jgi:hypothetical protein
MERQQFGSGHKRAATLVGIGVAKFVDKIALAFFKRRRRFVVGAR